MRSKKGRVPIRQLCMMLSFAGVACGTGASAVAPVSSGGPPISSIAVVSGGGALAGAVEMELIAAGFRVIPVIVDGRSDESLAALAREADAYLTLIEDIARDGKLATATARLQDARTDELIAVATWQNSRGPGQEGSLAYALGRKSASKAGKELVVALLPRIPH